MAMLPGTRLGLYEILSGIDAAGWGSSVLLNGSPPDGSSIG
jgi:hypothetical protein